MSFSTRLQRAALRRAASLPAPLLRLLVGGEVRSMEGDALYPEHQLVLRALELIRQKQFHELSVRRARGRMELSMQIMDYGSLGLRLRQKTRDRTIPGPAGEIPVRIYSPGWGRGARPVLVYFHGGGFVIGSIATCDGVCRVLSKKANAIVVSVDYRLAPEHKFPAAVDDAVAATRWVLANAESFGGDSRAVAVGGDSAGGNLAAVVAQATKDDAARPMFQLLIYPATDLTRSFPSHDEFGAGYLLPKQDMDWFMAAYLNSESERRDPRASPLFATDVRGLPPVHLQTAGFDPLRDEGRAYAEKLRSAGVSVDHRCVSGAMHGYFSFGGVFAHANRAVEEAASGLREAFDRVR